jgi:hypothetical protein
MKLHKGRAKRGPFGGVLNGTLCGRLSAESEDGMNIAETDDAVSCTFCLRALAKMTPEKRAAMDAMTAEMLMGEL